MADYLVTGGTGFVGTALTKQLLADGHTPILLTRRPEAHRRRFPASVRLIASLDEIDDGETIEGIINLAGEGIADKRWSEKRKQVLIDSHAGVTRQVVELVARLRARPSVMVSGSAVGYYGSRGDEPLAEDAEPVPEFTHELCRIWEEAAEGVEAHGVRLCIVRLGVVLEKHGGMLKRLLPPFYCGLGGRLGSGRQMLSWIHLADVIKAVKFLLETPDAKGVYNLTAPHPVTNARFTRELARAIRRPAILPLPGFVVRTVFGEMGDRLLLNGQNVVPVRLNRAGYVFEYESLEEALGAIFSR